MSVSKLVFSMSAALSRNGQHTKDVSDSAKIGKTGSDGGRSLGSYAMDVVHRGAGPALRVSSRSSDCKWCKDTQASSFFAGVVHRCAHPISFEACFSHPSAE